MKKSNISKYADLRVDIASWLAKNDLLHKSYEEDDKLNEVAGKFSDSYMDKADELINEIIKPYLKTSEETKR